jgi:hypothetical protein
MKRGSTLFLKAVVLLISLLVFALCIFLISQIFTKNLGGYFPIIIGMLIASIPFFIGVFQTMKLLNLIDKNHAFSQLSINSLEIIKKCGTIICIMYGLGLPYIFIVAQRDDAPGVILLGLIFTFAPMIVAVFATVLQKVLQNAIDLKSENELAV